MPMEVGILDFAVACIAGHEWRAFAQHGDVCPIPALKRPD
jgi:hypothetical protein